MLIKAKVRVKMSLLLDYRIFLASKNAYINEEFLQKNKDYKKFSLIKDFTDQNKEPILSIINKKDEEYFLSNDLERNFFVEFFTGLIDKNGTKIYERDIVRVQIINEEQGQVLNEAIFEVVSSLEFFNLKDSFDFELRCFGGMVIDKHKLKPELFLLSDILGYYTSYKNLDELENMTIKTEIELLSNAHFLENEQDYLVKFFHSLNKDE